MTATRSPRALLEKLTLSGAPMPRTTSHSVWPSATVPVVEGDGLPAAPSASALAPPPGGAIPGQPPSAATSSSGVTAFSGLSGGVSIDTFRMNTRPVRENQSASFDMRSDALEQPASAGPSSNKVSSGFRSIIPRRTLDPGSAFNCKHLSDHHFAARPWLPARSGAETADYHRFPGIANLKDRQFPSPANLRARSF